MTSPPSILFLILCVLLLICSSYSRTNPSSLSSLPISRSLTGQQLVKDQKLHHPKLEVNIFKGYTNSSNDELKVSEFGLVEKQLSFQVLGDSGATVPDLAQHAGYFRLQHSIDARYVIISISLFRANAKRC